MFKKLELRIKSIVIITLALCFVFVGAISYSSIKKIIYDNFIQLSVQCINQQNKNVLLYMKLIEETSKQISKSPQVIEALQSTNYSQDMGQFLEEMQSLNSSIKDISVYGVHGNIYKSTETYSLKDSDSLSSNKDIVKFMKSDLSSYWLLRKENSIVTFSYKRFDKSNGVITFMTKILDSKKNLQGYMLMDLDAGSIYGFFNSDNSFSSYANVYITSTNNSLILSKYDKSGNQPLLKSVEQLKSPENEHDISPDNKYILVSNSLPNSNIRLVVARSMESMFRKLNMLLAIMISILILFVFAAAVTGIRLSKNISSPLYRLYTKMRRNSVQALDQE